MAEHIDDIIWSVNGEGFSLEYLNPAAGRIYERPVQAFFDNPTLWLEVVHPDDRETLERRHDELIEQGKAERYYRIIRPDGSIVWLHDSAWATRDDAGRLQRLCGISRDVTAQLEKNRRTLEQQSIHHSVFHNSHDAIFLVQIGEDGQFRYLETNAAHQQKTQLPLSAIVGRTPLEVLGPEQGAKALTQYRRCLEAAGPIEYEERLSLPGGMHDWLTQLVAIPNGEGKLELLAGLSRDITAIRDAERLLRKAQGELDRLLAASPAIVYACRPEPGIPATYVSPGLWRITGHHRDDVLNRTGWWESVTHPDDRAAHRQRIGELLRNGGSLQSRYRLRHAAGHYLWVQDEVRLLRNASGEAEEVVGALVDVSEPHGLDQRLQKLGEQLPGFVYQYQLFPDGTGRFPYASSKSWEIYGAGPAALLESDAPVLDTIHPDDYAHVVETIQQSAATLESWVCEYRICHPRGHELWASGRAAPERLADGSIIWHGFITDITQYRQTRLALEASEQRYRQIAENFSDLVCLHAPDPVARYRFVSPSARQMLGYAPEELIGRSAFELIHPEDRDRVIESSYQKVLAGKQEEGIEYRSRHQDGHYLWLETKTMPIFSGHERLIGLQTISRNITKRREAQDAFKALALRQERILEAAGEGIYGIDVRGNINFLNSAAATMLGWQLNEIQGMSTHHLFHHSLKNGTPRSTEHSIVMQALNSGQQLRAVDEWFLRRDGSGFAVELVASPLIEEGDVTGCVVVFQDITERKRSEALLERLSATDSLTEVANRRHFLQRLEQELARKNRHDSVASLLMFDADHFKRVNDRWGHAAGDDVLRQLSRTCQEMLRGSDLLGRLGGEEFAVLLPETDLGGARLFAERLRRAIEALEVPYAETTITFTISLGVTELEMGDTPESALERADRAMYRAKQTGRNRCCSETLDTVSLQ